MTMDERKKKILLAIVQDYIATAEPIGSRTIARKYELGVGSATVRNEMADLEEQGYIEQPHTSAGRVPSEQGYRYYVDYLMEKQQLNSNAQTYIRKGYESKKQDIATVIRLTSELLSQVTNYTSIVLGPNLGSAAVKHIQLIPVDEKKALVVRVSEGGLAQNKLIDIPDNISYEDMVEISRVLNAKLQGRTIDEISRTLISEIYFEISKHNEIFDLVMNLLGNTNLLQDEERVYLGGTLNILNQPEFRNIEKVKTLLSLLDHGELLKDLFQSTREEQGVVVKIGTENKLMGIQDCSMITATYQIDGKVVGSIGVLGPTRMDYAKVVSVVDFMTSNLSEVLSQQFLRRKK
ncbi:MAG TPA: heat-inducible transcriptional repressor HrcA [Bacillota bacterium]|nr:heat-inducible transcriptional repressor HrcA [Bacillota bacterium]